MKIIKIIAAISIFFFMPQAKAQTSENNSFIQDNTKTLSDKEKNELNQILKEYNTNKENPIKIKILIKNSNFTEKENFSVPESTIIMALNPETEKYYTLISKNIEDFFSEKEINKISNDNQVFFENHKVLNGFKNTINNVKNLLNDENIKIILQETEEIENRNKEIQIVKQYFIAYYIISSLLIICSAQILMKH